MEEAASSIFVNREKELRQISEAVETLQDEQRLLRTPIIEFSGVQGIGKTTLLQQVQAICDSKSLSCIMKNTKQWTPDDFHRVELLLGERPVAIILDSLDTIDSEQFQTIETGLSKLIENSRLFVVLASRNVQKFERMRSLARKLTIYPLEPLKRESCVLYLDKFAHTIPPNARDIILDWTRGYPIAMQVMTDTILRQKLDPTKEQDRKQLLRILMKEVIEEKLLVTATFPSERTRLRTLLALLSIPRRFNLTLMQDLIEQFAPEYKLENSLAYITLPRAINEVTSVLNWSMARAGYCIEAPVRNLFLLEYTIEEPQEYSKIHKFLAEKNESFAQEVAGSDRIRYLRELFYHLACSEEEAYLRRSLTYYIGQLAQVQIQEGHNPLQSLESFLQFYEEFQRDEELKEALGPQNTSFALSLIYRNFIEIYRQLPKEMRGNWLKEFFALVAQQPTNNDFVLIFEEGMRRIIQQVSREDAIKLFNELTREKELKDMLGAKFDDARSQILAKLLDEG